MRSLYYKSLDAHMRKFRKGQNLQELNDRLHNINLKQQLNSDLNKESAILNPIATDLKREEIKAKYKEHLGQYKEQKLRRKAEDKLKVNAYKKDIIKKKAQEAEEALMGAAKPLSTESALGWQQAFIKQMQRGSKYGLTKAMMPKSKPGPKGPRITKRISLNPMSKPGKRINTLI